MVRLPPAQWQKPVLTLAMMTLTFLIATPVAFGLFSQTQGDLSVLEDQLKNQLEKNPAFSTMISPLLVAPPLNHWQESRHDFSGAVLRSFSSAFPSEVKIISCVECDRWRMHIAKDQHLNILNGEISLEELHYLKKDSRYQDAKAYSIVRETPAGVETKIISLSDGQILFSALADSTLNLNRVNPYMGLSQERDRRQSGEALAYVFGNLGLYPTGVFSLEFVEQWGERNQHISGIGFSFLNPTFAMGAVYHYLLPKNRKVHFGGAVYYPLTEALGSSLSKDEKTTTGGFIFQGSAHYTFASSYGVFASLNSHGEFSLGFNFFNPLFLPFLL